MKKFDEKKAAVLARMERDLAHLELKEKEALERRMKPTVTKLMNAVERTARRLFEGEPERLEGASFKRATVEVVMAEMLDSLFPAPEPVVDDEAVEKQAAPDQASVASEQGAPENSTTPAVEPARDIAGDGGSARPDDDESPRGGFFEQSRN
jgi:hypothetical protein